MANEPDITLEISIEDEDDTLKERGENLAKKKKVREKLIDLYRDVEKGFLDSIQRAYDTQDYWDIYNCILGANQFYVGNSKICLPLVRNAVNARKTRFTNQVFPMSERHVEVVSTDPTYPYAIMSLMEHYIRKAKLRQLFPEIIINDHVEGQINISPYWKERTRHVVRRVKRGLEVEPGVEFDEEQIDDIEEEEVFTGHPAIDILHDSDILILPLTASSVEDAIDQGGSVTMQRRWSKTKIKEMIKAGHIDKSEGESVIEEMQKDHQVQTPDMAKRIVEAAGIKAGSTVRGKFALIYETWSLVKTSEGHRLCRTFFAGNDRILSCVRNPYWCDRVPLISTSVNKLTGAAKGVSQLSAVADLHYWANDSVNEAADSAAFGMMPIILTDPEKNPKVASMVLNLAAIWQTNPNDTRFAEFPQLWKHGFEMITALKQEIFQTLSVNPAQITGGSKKKQSQAEVANEQQVDVLTTADVVTVLEDSVLTPLLEWFVDLDHQYRDEAIQVRAFGELGMEAQFQDIEPLQLGARYTFKWLGVEAARNAQQTQQGIAMINVIKGIPPQMYKGYELDLAPVIQHMVLSTFGPRIAPQIFKKKTAEIQVDPMKENMLLNEGHNVPVHTMDNHEEHIIAHIQAVKERGDKHGAFRMHILDHQIAMAEKMQAQQPKGLPGTPGGAGPGVAGAPRPGAQPGVPRGGQNPPGMIQQDQLQDPRAMPRRMG